MSKFHHLGDIFRSTLTRGANQTRRPTRPIRANQSDENKTAKPTATTTRHVRVKSTVGQPSASIATSSKSVTSATGAGASDGVIKRKREALGEVTNGKGQKVGLGGVKKDIDRKF